jgi:four helix bundle protein
VVTAVESRRFKLDDFELYRVAREFPWRVYRLSHQLSPEKKYCLTCQMRRVALFISNNIAEGYGRWHNQENVWYCAFSRGSVDEVIDDLGTCLDANHRDQALVL